MWTMERRALSEPHRADRRAANPARLAAAAVDEQFLLEVAGLAVRLQEVAQRRAAARDRVVEDALGLHGEPCVLRFRDRSGRASRADAGGEQRFGNVDVADADDDLLVHQERLYRCRATARPAPQVGAIEIVAERLGPQRGKQPMNGI